MDDMHDFTALTIQEPLIQKLALQQIQIPTAVQKQVIPVIAQGTSVLFQSETGTGKTLAYLLPLIQKCAAAENPAKKVQLLILSPTYELASQIKTVVQTLTEQKVVLCIGGSPIKRQTDALKERPFAVIGNPARILELIHLKKLKTDGMLAVVLDEMDRLVSKEIKQATTDILTAVPKNCQIIGCSATVTKTAVQTVQKCTPQEIQTVYLPQEDVLRLRIEHWALYAETRDKINTLRQFLSAVQPQKAVVFTSRPDQVINIYEKLIYKKINCTALYAKADKNDRKAAINKFRSGGCPILITSDLASRGLDITGITHIIQMDLPSDQDFFVHRAGRTARAGAKGINVVIGDAYEMRAYAALEKKLGLTVYPKQLYGGKVVEPQADPDQNPRAAHGNQLRISKQKLETESVPGSRGAGGLQRKTSAQAKRGSRFAGQTTAEEAAGHKN